MDTMVELETRFPGVPFVELLDSSPDRSAMTTRAWDALSADMKARGYTAQQVQDEIGARPAGPRWSDLRLDDGIVADILAGHSVKEISEARPDLNPLRVRYHQDRLGLSNVRPLDREIGTWILDTPGTLEGACELFGVNVVTARRALYKILAERRPITVGAAA